ncbi:MAG: FAD-dependent oxidoreductase [Lachnospiraceae bacterium]|nr:FAD-dependent oxidoreductase [Lachnospiraceae bacterium]
MLYDVIIIGAGPAGLTAGIYAKRACLNTLILQDKYSVGSQICNTYEVANYPGFNGVTGQELYDSFKKHADELNVPIVNKKVIEISDADFSIKKIKTADNLYETKTIVYAAGASPKKYGFEGEDHYVGNGVSYCATCDGAFYKNKIVAVIGGGDVAVEDAIFMSRIASKVYLIMRRTEMRATKILQEEVKKLSNVEILYEVQVESIIGDDKVEGALIRRKGDVIPSEVSLDAIFVGIGIVPDTALLKGKVEMDGDYIIANENCATSTKGIYVVGDARKKQLRQVITACADGANAITSIQKYLTENKI